MAQVFANQARSTLAAAITATATSLTLANGAAFPVAASGGDWFKAVIQDDTGFEIITVQAHASGAAAFTTIVRGQDGTTAKTFAIGATVGLRMTAADMVQAMKAPQLKSIAFTVIGSSSFTPTTAMLASGACRLIMVAGGGGGGGGGLVSAGSVGSGGGGGGSGQHVDLIVPVTSAAAFSLYVGDGGAAGANQGSNGSAGEANTANISGVSYVATGGGGGFGGGSVANDGILMQGGAGGASDSNRGMPGSSAIRNYGGLGGYGGQVPSLVANTSTGVITSNFGRGGDGGGSNAVGTKGTSGFIRIDWYE